MQQSTPLISVVMTSYNHQNYISEAIESVLNQTFKDFELIIVDDASTDNSVELINHYQKKDPRIKTIFHSSNKGIPETTNDGFEIARGQFAAYTNSDDVWIPEKLEKQIQILEKNPDFVVWSDAMIIDANGRETGQLFSQMQDIVGRKKSGYIFPQLVKGNFICAISVIFATRIARQIKFDTNLSYANDYKFMIDVSKNHHFYFISEPLVKYRIHGQNSILKNREGWERDNFIIAQYVIRKYGNEIPNDFKAILYRRIGKYLFKRKHYAVSRKCFWASIITNPLKTSSYRNYIFSLVKKSL